MRRVLFRQWAALLGLVLIGMLRPASGQQSETPPLSLNTRLLFGIGTVTLVALLVSLLVPLETIRSVR